MTKKATYLIFFLCLVATGFSQEINTKVTVVSPYEPSISDASKINTMPQFTDTAAIRPAFNYTIHSEKLNVDFSPRPINPAKMVIDPQPKLYKSYLKMGIGNYMTPMAELNISTLRSKNFSYGFYARHQSSHKDIKLKNNQKVWGGYNDNVMLLYGKRIFEPFTVDASGGLKHNTVYYYGFNSDSAVVNPYNKNDYRQDIMDLNGKISLESHHPYDSNKLYYAANVGYDLVTDKFFLNGYFKNYEQGIRTNVLLKKNIKGFYTSLFAGVDYYGKSSSFNTSDNTIICIHPSVTRSSADWKFNIGIKTIVDKIDVSSLPYFYPDLKFEFNAIQDVVRLYFGLDGGMKVNNYGSIIYENPFIVPNLNVKNSNTKLNTFIGAKGSLSSKIEFNLGVSFSKIDNQYFFVNDTINRFFFNGDPSYIAGNQFIVVYDDIQWIRYFAEFNVMASDKFNMLGKLEVNDYKMFKQAYAWHMPAVKASLMPRYNLRNKILVSADLNYIGKRYARSPYQNGEIIVLEDMIDLNLGVEYRYTKMMSLFVRFNNLAAYKYYLWNQFPLQRFHVMAGFTYSL